MKTQTRFYELALCILNYGFINGTILFVKLKLKLTYRIVVSDAKFPITLRPKSSDQLVFKQVFLFKEYNLNKNFGTAIPDDFKVIIDAGANIGLASIYFATKYPFSKIIAIEPELNNFRQLKLNTVNYQNIIPIQAALWPKVENLSLSNPGNGDWGFTVEKLNNVQNGIIIPALTVDELMKNNNIEKIDLFKIDIEGAEKEVFEGDINSWISKTEVLIVELHDRMKPGCSRVFFESTKNENFAVHISGENLICSRI